MKTQGIRLISAIALGVALGLSACGDGGDPLACNSGVAKVDSLLNPDGCPSGTSSTAAASTAQASLSLALTDASGTPLTSVSPGQAGTLQATVKDGNKNAVPNVAVAFTTSDKTGVFVPASGTALTDAAGVARVGLAAGAQVGAFTVTANANVGTTAAAGRIDYTVSSAALVSLNLSLADASGAPTTSVSPGQAGTLQATVKDRNGSAVPYIVVTFVTTDKTGVFVPASGTALTDAAGVARVGLSAGTQVGAFTVTANAAVGVTGTAGTTDYKVTFPALSLSALSINPATLSAGGNANISVTVSSGSSIYAPPLSVSFASPCITAAKATLGSPVLTQSGIATASYTDKGCGVADTITASVTLGGATVTQTGTITVLPAGTGAIKFISADTTNIALKGTGGFGRQEVSTLTFQVLDITGNPLPGRLVDFLFSDSNAASTMGGLALNPASATSGADGKVTTLVSAGTMPTSVRVVASIRDSSPRITTLSNILVISTGVPDQRHFSLASETGNCEGRDFDQTCSLVTATLGDHFGNPAPDGTAVNFTTKGGVIEASCVTGSLPPPGSSTPAGQTTNAKVGPGSGTCTVTLRASNPRPANGRVTVLAYAIGEEDLMDNNGNNVFDAGDTFADKSPDIFRDDNESGTWNAGEPCIGPNSNGLCSTPGDGQYNGVLRSPQLPSAQTLYVSNQLVQIFSGSHASVASNPSALSCPAGGTAAVQVTVTDEIGNIMPARTTVEFAALFGTTQPPVLPASITVPNVVLAVGQALTIPTYTVLVGCPSSIIAGKLFVTVTTPKGVITTSSIPIN